MRRIICVATIVCLLMSTGRYGAEAAKANYINTAGYTPVSGTVKFYITNQYEKAAYKVLKKDSYYHYPMKDLCEKLGATVTYDEATKTMEAVLNDNKVSFTADKTTYKLNGTTITMKKKLKAFIDKNYKQLYIPVRFAAEAFGFSFKYMDGQAYDLMRITQKPTYNEDTILFLRTYKDNYKGEALPGESIYIPNEEFREVAENDYVEQYGVDAINGFIEVAKGFTEIENNVDYRKADKEYWNKYKYYICPDAPQFFFLYEKVLIKNADELIKNRMEDVKKYKIVSQAEFITDDTLVYQSALGENRTRGRLKIKYSSIDPKYFEKYKIPKLKTNKWYYSDIEVITAKYFPQREEKWRYSDIETIRWSYYLTPFKEVK